MQQGHIKKEADASENTLYLRFAPTIFTYLSQQTANLQDAEDLLLEVFIAALNHGMLADFSEERQLAWLRKVARNKVIDRYRHRSCLAFLPLELAAEIEDNQLSLEQHVEQREHYAYLYQALQRLSPSQQELIQLRYGNGLRFAEIAALLARPEGTVRKLLVRTLHQLRKHYDLIEGSKEV